MGEGDPAQQVFEWWLFKERSGITCAWWRPGPAAPGRRGGGRADLAVVRIEASCRRPLGRLVASQSVGTLRRPVGPRARPAPSRCLCQPGSAGKAGQATRGLHRGQRPSGRQPFQKQRTVNPLIAPARYNFLYPSSSKASIESGRSFSTSSSPALQAASGRPPARQRHDGDQGRIDDWST
jgi:hypothetical protein